jgi:hypothetical protein
MFDLDLKIFEVYRISNKTDLKINQLFHYISNGSVISKTGNALPPFIWERRNNLTGIHFCFHLFKKARPFLTRTVITATVYLGVTVWQNLIWIDAHSMSQLLSSKSQQNYVQIFDDFFYPFCPRGGSGDGVNKSF